MSCGDVPQMTKSLKKPTKKQKNQRPLPRTIAKSLRKPKKNKKNKVRTHYGGPGLARMTLIIAEILYIIAKIIRIPPKY